MGGGIRLPLERQAWILYAVLFLWQFPHFMAIAWMYREDLRSSRLLDIANRKRGPLSGLDDRRAKLLHSLPLVWDAVLPATNLFQCSATVLLGSGLFFYAIRQILIRSRLAARQLLKATIIYLPLQFVILLTSKRLISLQQNLPRKAPH